LAPDIVESMVASQQPGDVTAEKLTHGVDGNSDADAYTHGYSDRHSYGDSHDNSDSHNNCDSDRDPHAERIRSQPIADVELRREPATREGESKLAALFLSRLL
jgi:hypothetical protein